MGRPLIRSVVVAVFAATGVLVHAQDTAPGRHTPGELAIMAARSSPSLEAALGAALADDRPEMRLTAARIAGVMARRSLAAAVTDALSRETHSDASREQQRALDLIAGRTGPPGRFPVTPMRTAPALFPGFLASLLAASPCRTSPEHSYAAVRVTYGADGRPTKASIAPGTSAACALALQGLMYVTLADREHAFVEGSEEWIVMLLGRDAMACADGPVSLQSVLDPSVQAAIVPPQKTSDVRPAYPRIALAAQIEGAVSLRAVVSTNGCVRDAVVVVSADAAVGRGTPAARGRGPTPGVPTVVPLAGSLDLAALLAVTQWHYVPARLNGKSVDVAVTVVTQFKVNKAN